MNEALKKSEEFHLEQTMLDDKLKATDWEATNEEIMELVARESYLQWLKDNEKRSMDRNALNLYCTDQMPSTNAQCSNWDANTSDLMGRNAYHHNNNNNSHQQNSSHRLNNSNRRTSTSTPPRSPSQSKLSSHLKSSPPQLQQQHQSKSNRNEELNYFDEKTRSACKTKPSTTSIISPTAATSNAFTTPNAASTSQPTPANAATETKNILNKLTPDLFGLNSNDWIGLDSGNGNDSDILAQVLAASQAEYLESLKAKRQQQQK